MVRTLSVAFAETEVEHGKSARVFHPPISMANDYGTGKELSLSAFRAANGGSNALELEFQGLAPEIPTPLH